MLSIFVPNLLRFAPNLENGYTRRIYIISNPFTVCKAIDTATKRRTILVKGLNHYSKCVHICFSNADRELVSM